MHSTDHNDDQDPGHDDDAGDSQFDDEAPTADELASIRAATPADEAAVDELILARCTPEWRKVAMVVGSSLDEFEARCPQLPYVYLQLRIAKLVERGLLEAQGDVMSMRRSEVRLKNAP